MEDRNRKFSKQSKKEQFHESTYNYLNEEVKPIFMPIVAKAIKTQPVNRYFFLLEELLNYKGEYLDQNPEKTELKTLRRLKSKLEEFILLNSPDDQDKSPSEQSKESKNEDDQSVSNEKFNDFIKSKGKLSMYRFSVSGEANKQPKFSILKTQNSFKGLSAHQNKEKEDNPPDLNQLLISSIKNSFLFSGVPLTSISIIISAFKKRFVKVNEVICKQGDLGNELYVVESGEFQCYIRPKFAEKTGLLKQETTEEGTDVEKVVFENESNFNNLVQTMKRLSVDTTPALDPDSKTPEEETKEEQLIKIKGYKRGDLFGELALMYNTVRMTTIVCVKEGVLWSLDRETYELVISSRYKENRTKYLEFINKVELLKDLSNSQKNLLCEAIIETAYPKDSVVIKQGEEGNTFYMVEEGELIAFKESSTSEGVISTRVNEYKSGDFFGELALVNCETRQATVIACCACKLLSLERASFKRLLGTLHSALEQVKNQYRSKKVSFINLGN